MSSPSYLQVRTVRENAHSHPQAHHPLYLLGLYNYNILLLLSVRSCWLAFADRRAFGLPAFPPNINMFHKLERYLQSPVLVGAYTAAPRSLLSRHHLER